MRYLLTVPHILALLASACALSSPAGSTSSSSSSSSSHVPRSGITSLPHGWKFHSRANPTTLLKLRLLLPQPNFQSLENALYAGSDPYSPSYGTHLTKEQSDILTAPHPDSARKVDEWLAGKWGLQEDYDFTKNDAGDWITIHALPISKAEQMFNCEFNVYKHKDLVSGKVETTIRTMRYGVPRELDDHLELVQPTTMFARPRAMRSSIIDDSLIHDDTSLVGIPLGTTVVGTAPAAVNISCNATITPQCLSDLYGYSGYVPRKDIGNKLGVTGYLEQYANKADLQSFYTQFYPKALGTTFAVKSINSGQNNQSLEAAGGEADLDVQYTGAVSFPIPNTFYTVGGRPPYIPDALTGPDNYNEPYADFLEYIGGLRSPPQVVSTSYDDNEQTVPKDYAIRVCRELARISSRGVSFLFSSGDGGVSGAQTPPYCASNDGKNTTKFIPTFPSSCPYVTSVGGTRYIEPEIGVSFSSGGFSEYFKVPDYQKAATKSFLTKLGPTTYKGLYNPGGRGIPDIAAQSVRFMVVTGGVTGRISGTSASTPAMSGIIALLNDWRIRNGKAPLGFLNPWLYSIGKEGLTDIIKGNNPGCGTQGFNATVGWDPITGLGTPIFPKLKKLALWKV